MQNCLGIYIENNLIKYAKVSKSKEGYKVETFGMNFFEDLDKAIKKVVEETYSFNTPITINLANERFLYYDIFSLLSKNDIDKTVGTEFEVFCDDNKYNPKAFETRYILVPDTKNPERITAMQVIVNKIELNKQKQFLEKQNLYGILPIGTAITSIVKTNKKENVLIVNMEEKTTFTTVCNQEIISVSSLDYGSEEVLEKINRLENSMSKAYEICKSSTIYTANVIDDEKEQPYLEYIIPTLYQIGKKIQEEIANSTEKISTVYLTGTLSVVNNVDLYFQELLPDAECKILKPSIIEGNITQINIKDYIEVNSAIALAAQTLGDKTLKLNFKKSSFLNKAKQMMNVEIGAKSKNTNKKSQSNNKADNKFEQLLQTSFKGPITTLESFLIEIGVAIILICIIYIVFSNMLYKQMENKQEEVKSLISKQQAEISKINSDKNTLNLKNTRYLELTEEIKEMNDKISNIAEMKNSIPNLLNQIMYVIPEGVQITSIENTTGKTIKIVAQSESYDQLGYFIAKIKLEEMLKNTVSSSGQKTGGVVVVAIEGELP